MSGTAAFEKAGVLMDKVARRSGTIQKINSSVEKITHAFDEKPVAVNIDLDAAKDGPIYGDPEGLSRVERLEKKLANMKIREDHPRIFITPEDVEKYRERLKDKRFRLNAFEDVLGLAEKGEIVNLAFVYLMLEKDNPDAAGRCARQVIQMLMEKDPLAGDSRFIAQEVGKMALAFDWVYNAMSDDQRKYVVKKLSKAAGIKKRADAIRGGLKESGETFHREEWMFDSYRVWPEIALAHHDPDAEFIYKARWNYDWYWGDAARMYAYAADGTPFEGYYNGADGVDWFLALRSATGINLIDGEFGWCKNAANYILYRIDFDRGREIFHHGVCYAAAGCVSYKNTPLAWKVKAFFGRTLPLAQDNPYIRWLVEREFNVSSWMLTMAGYGEISELRPIAKFLFYDLGENQKDAAAAPEKLPLGILFPGGNEAYMRTGWAGKPVCVGFRSSPAYTKTSHGDFDINTFVIYKDGVLSTDSGVYDGYGGQQNYFSYQKTTVAHNDLLVLDPSMKDGPRKFGRSDPGGIDEVFTRAFGAPTKFGQTDTFLHNPYADWSDLAAFKTTPYYDYVVGDAHKAYRDRLDKYYRTLVFVRKENKAYLVIYDKVKLKKQNFQMKWLMHFVSEPKISGQKIKEEVPGHIEWYRGNFLKAKNVFNTSELFLKVLKADDFLIRKIGGSGYEYWVDGSKPRNIPVPAKELTRVEEQIGGKWQESGTWRIELVPQDKKLERDLINVIYIGDADEPFNPDNVVLREDASSYTIEITDVAVPTNITFLKGEEPMGSIVIKDKISENFPEIKKR